MNIINILDSPIEFIKGVGPAKAAIFKSELNVQTAGDLIHIYPFRYIDRTQFSSISEARTDGDIIQLKGKIIDIQKIKGKNNRYRLVASFKDGSGFMDLVWFQSVKVIEEILKIDGEYIVFGKVKIFNGHKSIVHPEVELFVKSNLELKKTFDPVYSSTDALDKKNMDNRWRRKIVKSIIDKITSVDFPEILPVYILKKIKLGSRYDALHWIHFPKSEEQKIQASNRLKFDEAFFMQLRLIQNRINRQKQLKGIVFDKIGHYFNTFYKNHLKFELTNAQKRVVKEIRADVGNGSQMNRLLQGDVGSGKTIVAVLTMLIAKDNGYQSCLMAPTEILAQQHYNGISEVLDGLGLRVAFLSGSVKGKKRTLLFEELDKGIIDILIGTHALIEDKVNFKNLGLAIIDEQHRFGVSQRSKLWRKGDNTPPHILVMTATPIPRTLAMTIHGELDVSKIDELPPGRKEIKTVHQFDSKRPRLIKFLQEQIAEGRQVYIVYPLIEESDKLELASLTEGYERLLPHFPQPKYQISIVHGRMKPDDKEWEMQRFLKKETHIMIATTVIEVGVNVPNASVMVIENAERFGLSQLHQLRGRVGRGASQSYCVLMSGYKLSAEAKERLSTMVRTNDGFEIAEVDLRLRGPGSIEGTQQSGIPDLKILNLIQDETILKTARYFATEILNNDYNLEHPAHVKMKEYLKILRIKIKDWGRIS